MSLNNEIEKDTADDRKRPERAEAMNGDKKYLT